MSISKQDTGFFTFPTLEQVETKAILKQLNLASRALAQLQGSYQYIPNPQILINTLPLQEAKNSSEIESIVTTQDALFKVNIDSHPYNASTKEVKDYSDTLLKGFDNVKQTKLLTLNHIQDIYRNLEKNDGGFRKSGDTVLKDNSGNIIYTPPQNPATIIQQMDMLEKFINDDAYTLPDSDPLIRMAILHLLFESVHPFIEGNGRSGRIINILYLVLKDLLDMPILYLSGYIVAHKSEYYRLLQHTRETHEWEDWIIYMLTAIEHASKKSTILVREIKNLMQHYKHKMRDESPNIYSQELLNHLFSYPYTKISHLGSDLNITRITATKYLDKLANMGLLEKEKLGKTYYYVNIELLTAITD